MVVKKWKWRGFDPETGTQEEIAEYIQDMKDLTAQAEEAVKTVQAVLDDKELWFDLEAVALELNDATDDLRDSITGLEEKFRERKIRPGWIHFREGEALIWNGATFMVETANGLAQLTYSNKERRADAAGLIPDLYEELIRPRLKDPIPKRTPKVNAGSKRQPKAISSPQRSNPR